MVFVKLAEASEIQPGTMKPFTVEGKEVLVLNVNGKFYAMGAKCTHMGGDLSKGTLQGIVLTCPRHGARFDVTTGKSLSGPKFGPVRLKTGDEPAYPVQVEGTSIAVDIG